VATTGTDEFMKFIFFLFISLRDSPTKKKKIYLTLNSLAPTEQLRTTETYSGRLWTYSLVYAKFTTVTTIDRG